MDTSSEAYRMACEARWCLTLDREARQAYYAMVQARRGAEAVGRLIDAVKAEHRRQQGDLFGG